MRDNLRQAVLVPIQLHEHPHSMTGVHPAEFLFDRRLQSRLDLLKPSLESLVEYKQAQQKNARD